MVRRILNLSKLIGKNDSCLLFGARGVGKTHLLEAERPQWDPVLWFDLLDFDLVRSLLADPGLFPRQIEAAFEGTARLTVVVDEVQKLPFLLDYAHQLLEKHPQRVRFVLTGSSALKLKHGGGNLLAGRAFSFRLHPFTHEEIVFQSEKHLLLGSIPAMFKPGSNSTLALRAYVQTYLREEVLQESLVRKAEGFTRFLDVASQFHGKIPNMTTMAKAAGVSPKTVAGYFQILEDTMMCWRLPGWHESTVKQLRIAPKFYLFDNGVANALRGELTITPRKGTSRYGDLFEAWVVQEAFRALDNWQLELRFAYWQTNTGQEIDLIVSRGLGRPKAAIEIKSDSAPTLKDVRALKSFAQEYPEAQLRCWCQTPKPYRDGSIVFQPWQMGLAELKEF